VPTARRSRDHLIAAALERWFAEHERPLPWRSERSGYAALVSEAMLQQTQVSRVIDRYVAFMRRFPTVRALADAGEAEVLAAWQGLGYYGRAKRLHAAARAIIDRFGGVVPTDVDELRTLPGVGRYTAGAIASIAFEAREPIVDTNVARVLMRLEARHGVAGERGAVDWAWERATELVGAALSPARFNEGLMELGATICPAGRPACATCPLQRWCEAHRRGVESVIPEPARKATRKRVYHHAVVFVRGGKVLLVQRPDRGLWSSMWQVPTVESESAIDIETLCATIRPKAITVGEPHRIVHQTTHREVIFLVHQGATRARGTPGVWVDRTRLADFALSNPMRAIVESALA
jgi:A/G-specific adenine glycosylase